MNTNEILQGDCLTVLQELPENSVHMAMCSPPYYGLRDYGDETYSVWGGDNDCNHEFTTETVYQESPIREGSPGVGEQRTTTKGERYRSTRECYKCGAREDQLGLEPSFELYIQHLVEIGNEIRRILTDDGNWWLNLGDSFSGSGGADGKPNREDLHRDESYPTGTPHTNTGLGRKNKMLIPHRVAIALQDDGWIVRGDCVWAKPNPMPGPWIDRLNETKEFLFHLTPNPDYYFDLDVIREPHKSTSIERTTQNNGNPVHNHNIQGNPQGEQTLDPNKFNHPNGKNPGDVFQVTVKPFPEAHFAVYPPKLCEKPIKASCPEDGIVLDPFCGAGTTLLKAKELGRDFIGIELNPEYADMARARVGLDVHNPSHLRGVESQVGFELYE